MTNGANVSQSGTEPSNVSVVKNTGTGTRSPAITWVIPSCSPILLVTLGLGPRFAFFAIELARDPAT